MIKVLADFMVPRQCFLSPSLHGRRGKESLWGSFTKDRKLLRALPS
jgi:hypothetical protein